MKDYPLSILFPTLGMTSLISSSDLITMFLAIELQSLVEKDLISVLFTAKILNPNDETDKSQILSNNKVKAGISQWTHKDPNKRYVGSAVEIS